MKQLALSFIIPTLNEEDYLPSVLKSISVYTPAELTYEIVIADNGSDDKTVPEAQNWGAHVIIDKYATVGRLRNLAVKKSRGRVLVFLDADILLTEVWGENISFVVKTIFDNPYQVTGSRCGIPKNASWIEETWFKPLINKPAKYINSGHLITSRDLFESIGGFDEKLETGEDYALCQAATELKAKIVNNPLLEVVHDGYPKTIYQFFRREMWHGRGDCDSLRSLLSSKVAITSLLFILLHFMAVTGFVVVSSFVAVLSVCVILCICVVSSAYKHNARTIKDLGLISFMYYLYFFARFLSCVSFLSVRSVRVKV